MSTGSGPPRSPWAVFWVASIAVFLVGLDTTMLFAAFRSIRQDFPDTSAVDLSWVLNGYTVVYAGLLIPAGGLADAYGRKRMFLLGVAVFLVASGACGMAPNATVLVAARVLQAIGAALLSPASLSIVLATFPHERRSYVVSVWGAVGGLAAAVGPSLGSVVIDTAGWRWAFFLNLPIGAVSLWQGARLLKSDRPGQVPARADGLGLILIIGGIGAVALAIVESESVGWTPIALWATGLAGAAALVAFVAWERMASMPLLDLRLFRDTSYSFVNVASLTFGAAFSMMFLGFFLFLTSVWHYSLARAGVAVTPGPLLVMPVALVAGRLASRYGHRPFLIAGAVVYACSGIWFCSIANASPSYWAHWFPGIVMSGVGVGMVSPSLSAAAVNALPPSQYAMGSAVNQASRQIGSVLGVAWSVLLVGSTEASYPDFRTQFAVQASLALLTGVLCWRVRTGPNRRGHHHAQSGDSLHASL